MPPGSASSSQVEDTLADTRVVDKHAEPGVLVGEKIGRYMVLHRVGSGGMGVVYGAYDPELDRKVALKLLHLAPGEDLQQQTRLQREAQAMARLSHPHVVTVHDVGTHRGQIFVAMEFIEGRTLSEWRKEQQRSWAEVVDIFQRAGEGLAAAHAAGLVHRDFKPDNVLVANDGQVRVADFGLVQSTGETRSAIESVEGELDTYDSSPSLLDSMDVDLTRTGALLGTPAYMSPEQFSRLPLDARSDQFSFCAALYEALYNQRPFAAPNLPALVNVVIEGQLSPLPEDSEVPPWLQRIVLRGLSTSPNARWPSMHALLEAIDSGASSSRGRSRALQRGALLCTGLAFALALAWSTREREDPAVRACAEVGQPMQALWNPARAQDLSEGFTAASPAFGDEIATSVVRSLDDYAAQWIAASRSACEATQRGQQSQELLDLRMICLQRRLSTVDALTTALGEADLDTTSRAVELLASLEPLAPCSDLEALRRGNDTALEPYERELVERSYEGLAQAKAAFLVARYEQATALVGEAIELADAVQRDPVYALALRLRGDIEAARGENEAAERSYDEAAAAALRSGDAETLASVLIAQGNHVGFGLARAQEGVRLLDYARAALERHGAPSTHEGELENTLGLLDYARGDYSEAIVHFERVLELRAAQWGPDHPQTASILNNLGAIAFAKGDNEASRAYHERTLAIWRAAYGPDHPDVAVSLNNLATLADIERDHPRAEALFREALDLRERVFGAMHPSVAMTSSNLGISLEGAKRPAEALEAHRRAFAIYEASLSADHPKLAGPLTGIARSLLAIGEPEGLVEAERLAERSLAIRSAGEVAPYDLAHSRFILAKLLVAREGDRLRALELAFEARRALLELEGVEPELDEIDEWLASVGAGP